MDQTPPDSKSSHVLWPCELNFFLTMLNNSSSEIKLQFQHIPISNKGLLWPWSYGSWIYNYLCNQCPSPLMLWVRISIRAGVQHYMIKFVSDLRQVSGFVRVLRFPPPTDRHNITEILLTLALNTIKQTKSIMFFLVITAIIWQVMISDTINQGIISVRKWGNASAKKSKMQQDLLTENLWRYFHQTGLIQ